jgi:hypothetical protein
MSTRKTLLASVPFSRAMHASVVDDEDEDHEDDEEDN